MKGGGGGGGVVCLFVWVDIHSNGDAGLAVYTGYCLPHTRRRSRRDIPKRRV